jgi:predicted ester cyclase
MPDAKLEKNKAIMRRMMEAFNTGNTAIVAELLDPTVRDRSPKHGFEAEMRAAPPTQKLRTEIMRQEDVFPDRKFKEELLVAEGDTVVLHWSMTGTNKGQIMGRRATGKKIEINGTEIVRIRNGKIVEHFETGGHVFEMLFQLDLLDTDMVKNLKSGARELGAGHRSAPPTH